MLCKKCGSKNIILIVDVQTHWEQSEQLDVWNLQKIIDENVSDVGSCYCKDCHTENTCSTQSLKMLS